MNAIFLKKIRNSCLLLLLSFLCQQLYAQKKIVITFDETGRMTSQPLPRMKLSGPGCKCKKIDRLSVRVLLSVDYFDMEKKKLDTLANGLYGALTDKKSMLYKILNAKKPQRFDTLSAIVTSQYINDWDIEERKDERQIIPYKLKKYYAFISGLDSLKSASAPRKDSMIKAWDRYAEFAPYRLRIKGNQLDVTCMHFEKISAIDKRCDCMQPTKKYIAVVFDVPRQIVEQDAASDSFQVVQHFEMNEFAIKQYNSILDENSSKLRQLREIQAYIKKNAAGVSEIISLEQDVDSLSEKQFDTAGVAEMIKEKNSDIDTRKNELNKKIGEFHCDTTSTSYNVFTSSDALAEWVYRLVWLNGELVRMNPFTFSNHSSSKETDTPAAASKEESFNTSSDSARLSFVNAALENLKDTVLLHPGYDLEAADSLNNLILQKREKYQAALNAHLKVKKESDQARIKSAASDNGAGSASMNSFVTTSKVKYKGWFVPYSTGKRNEHDRIWLRNYYYKSPQELNTREKFKFNYPEDENVTLLIHNLTPVTAVYISESGDAFVDSSEFNKVAAGSITQLSQLYTSLNPVAAVLQAGLKQFNVMDTSRLTFLDSYNNRLTGSTVLEFATGKLNTSRDLQTRLKKISFIWKGREHMMGLDSNAANTNVQLKNTAIKIIDTLDPVTCYNKYLYALNIFSSAPDFIDEHLKVKEDSVPLYYTKRYMLTDSLAPFTRKYTIHVAASSGADSAKQFTEISSFINVAPYRHFFLAAGLAYTPNAGAITSVDTSNGGFSINRDNDKIRVIVGVRYYPWGLYNLKNPSGIFSEGRWLHRLSIIAGTGIPKPLQNLYAGGGFDLFPGLNISAGAHFQLRNSYTIVSNQITDRRIHYQPELFYSLTMDPQLFINAITAMFK